MSSVRFVVRLSRMRAYDREGALFQSAKGTGSQRSLEGVLASFIMDPSSSLFQCSVNCFDFSRKWKMFLMLFDAF